MSRNDLFLTSSEPDKIEFRRMMDAAVRAITASLEDPRAFSGIAPDALKKLVRTDTLLPERGM